MTTRAALSGNERAASRLENAKRDARELLVFADGVEDAGHPELARRSRSVARDALALAASLAAERSARIAIQADRDRLLAMMAAGRRVA